MLYQDDFKSILEQYSILVKRVRGANSFQTFCKKVNDLLMDTKIYYVDVAEIKPCITGIEFESTNRKNVIYFDNCKNTSNDMLKAENIIQYWGIGKYPFPPNTTVVFADYSGEVLNQKIMNTVDIMVI